MNLSEKKKFNLLKLNHLSFYTNPLIKNLSSLIISGSSPKRLKRSEEMHYNNIQ